MNYTYPDTKYNDLLHTATRKVKNNEWTSLEGHQPRHPKFLWWLF